MCKKTYAILISGEDSDYTTRELTDSEYKLIKGICDDLNPNCMALEVIDITGLTTEEQIYRRIWQLDKYDDILKNL